MERMDRLPAIPLITSDPYLSIWMPADTMTQTDAAHWSGPVKPIRGAMTVDGAPARFLGLSEAPEAKLAALEVSPTITRFVSEFGGVRLETRFAAPAFPDDPDWMSRPVTLVELRLSAADEKPHEVSLSLRLSDRLCYDGEIRPEMTSGAFESGSMRAAWCGQAAQKPLSHSGDHITIDWGYLYLCSESAVRPIGDGLEMSWSGSVQDEQIVRAVVAYDDIASINYFGDLCKAWYRRNGAQITDAIRETFEQFDALLRRSMSARRPST